MPEKLNWELSNKSIQPMAKYDGSFRLRFPVFGKDGEVNGLIVVDKDITEQKRAEEGLR